MNSGAYVELSYNPRAERIASPLQLDPRVAPLPAGLYQWNEWMLVGATDESRAVSATFEAVAGGLWNGTQRTLNLTLTLRPSYHLWASLGIQRAAADLAGPGGKFVEELWTLRGNYSFTTNMFVDALAQYDASTRQLDANVRFDLIHHPLSNLFLVYNEQRSTRPAAPRPGRSVILKVTRMVAF